jgi:hypothetical protein
MMKIILLVLAILFVVIVLMAVIGACLPRSHEAARAAVFHRKPTELYAVVRDFAMLPSWRSDLQSTEILPSRDGRVCYREISRHRPITYVVLEDRPAEKLTVKIADENLPFGGTWTFAFSPETDGCCVRITEHGEVKNVLFRFMARFIFGYTGSIDNYLRDLGKKFGETVVLRP